MAPSSTLVLCVQFADQTKLLLRPNTCTAFQTNYCYTSSSIVMNAGLIHRRKQFSSCDACRKSRVACDAVRGRSATGLAACTRCANRNRRCSFEVGDHLRVNSILSFPLMTTLTNMLTCKLSFSGWREPLFRQIIGL
jgi:hypothetical protein